MGYFIHLHCHSFLFSFLLLSLVGFSKFKHKKLASGVTSLKIFSNYLDIYIYIKK